MRAIEVWGVELSFGANLTPGPGWDRVGIEVEQNGDGTW